MNTVSEDKESESLGLEKDSYKGPMTRSRTKGTTTPIDIAVKANQEMEQHFEFDPKSVQPDLIQIIQICSLILRLDSHPSDDG